VSGFESQTTEQDALAENVAAAGPQSSSTEAVSAPPAQEPPKSPVPTELDSNDLDALSSFAQESGILETGAAPPTTSLPSAVRLSPPGAEPFSLPSFEPAGLPAVDPKRVTMLSDVNLRVKIELGRTRMLVEDVLKLGEGSVVELDKLAGDPVDVYANDRLVARGEILVLDESFCVRISDVVSRDPHRIIR
jgi:flagellar motor switch protein FliN/FliY